MDRTSRWKTKQRNNESNRHYDSNGPNRYLENISPKHKRIYLLSTSQNILENVPQSKSQRIQENWNNTLYSIKAPGIKAGYQQQEKQQKAYYRKETEQLLMNNYCVKAEIKKEMKDFLEFNENES